MNLWSRFLFAGVVGSLLATGYSSVIAPKLSAGSGQIYVTVLGRHAILRVDDMTGAGWTTVGNWGNKLGQFIWPNGIFVDEVGRIYVTDRGNHQIVRANDITGTGWTTLGNWGSGIGQFNDPTGIVVDSVGRIYVADRYNHRIVRIDDMTGKGWTTLGTRGAGVNEFASPAGIVVDRAGRIYVTDSGNSRIVRVDDMTGAGWITLGTPGSGVNEFAGPVGIAMDAAGRIYVTDSGNTRIVRVNDMAGTGWATLSAVGSGITRFSQPVRISVDSAGRIYVADTGYSPGHASRRHDRGRLDDFRTSPSGGPWRVQGILLHPGHLRGRSWPYLRGRWRRNRKGRADGRHDWVRLDNIGPSGLRKGPTVFCPGDLRGLDGPDIRGGHREPANCASGRHDGTGVDDLWSLRE